MPLHIRFVLVGWSFAFTFFAVGCVDHECPNGYADEGEICRRIRDAGLEAGATAAEGQVLDGGEALDGAAGLREDSEVHASLDDAAADGGLATLNTAAEPCTPTSREDGGKCSPTVQGPRCDCEGAGYEGAAFDTIVFPDVPAGVGDALSSSSRVVTTTQELALAVLSSAHTQLARVRCVK